MKQIYLVLAAVAALLLTACGHGDDYRVACKEGNFDEAHDILCASTGASKMSILSTTDLWNGTPTTAP